MKSPVFHPRAKRLKSILAKLKSEPAAGGHAVPVVAAERQTESLLYQELRAAAGGADEQ